MGVAVFGLPYNSLQNISEEDIKEVNTKLQNQALPELMASLFGNERINLHVKVNEKEELVFGILFKDGTFQYIQIGELENPTMRAYTDEKTAITIINAEDPLTIFFSAIQDGKITYSGVGILNKIKHGFLSVAVKMASFFRSFVPSGLEKEKSSEKKNLFQEEENACPEVENGSKDDQDGDMRSDLCDNCPSRLNYDQADRDANGIGDACQSVMVLDLKTQESRPGYQTFVVLSLKNVEVVPAEFAFDLDYDTSLLTFTGSEDLLDSSGSGHSSSLDTSIPALIRGAIISVSEAPFENLDGEEGLALLKLYFDVYPLAEENASLELKVLNDKTQEHFTQDDQGGVLYANTLITSIPISLG